jgi:C4-dicarboxylate-specific signal transduction histidine kinase
LAAILSNAQAARRFLEEPVPDLKEIREIIEDIIHADKRAAEVIQRLRSLFLKNNPEPVRNLAINAIVLEVVSLLNSELIAQDVTLDLDLEEPSPQIRYSRVDLQQILLNLLVNAMDAMERPPRRVRIATVSCGEWVVLSVADTGTGIPDHVMPDIFRPYFTTKATGMGMGLPVASSMAESHGGRIRAENLPGVGAVFHVDIPRVEPTAGEEKA